VEPEKSRAARAGLLLCAQSHADRFPKPTSKQDRGNHSFGEKGLANSEDRGLGTKAYRGFPSKRERGTYDVCAASLADGADSRSSDAATLRVIASPIPWRGGERGGLAKPGSPKRLPGFFFGRAGVELEGPGSVHNYRFPPQQAGT